MACICTDYKALQGALNRSFISWGDGETVPLALFKSIFSISVLSCGAVPPVWGAPSRPAALACLYGAPHVEIIGGLYGPSVWPRGSSSYPCLVHLV